MTFYQTLGVSSDATADDIKKAYRGKARATHPDKGGDSSEFADVAKAYEVLSDPERRLLYDATGSDKQALLETEVQNALLALFNEALSQPKDIEITAYVRNALTGAAQHIPNEVNKLHSRREKLEAKRGKITSSGTNLVHQIIDSELRNIDAKLAMLERQSNVIVASLKALDQYDEEWQEPPSQPFTLMDLQRTKGFSISI